MTFPPDPYADDPWSWGFVIFRHIPGFSGYGADTDGNVWSCRPRNGIGPFARRWRRLIPGNSHGYSLYGLQTDGGNRKSLLGHSIILTTFVGPSPAGMEGCHGNGIRSDNRLVNLRWDTCQANHGDAIRHGTHPKGGRHGNAKIDEAGAVEVKRLLSLGIVGRVIAGRMGVSESAISNIKKGITWRHIS